MEAWVLCFQLREDRCFGKCFSEPMAFANISDLCGFLDFLTILQLFDNFLIDLPTVSFTSTINPIILNHHLGRTNWRIHWCSYPEPRGEYSLSWPPSAPASPPPLLPTLALPLPGLVVDSIFSEVFNIDVSGAAIRLNHWINRWKQLFSVGIDTWPEK